MKNARAPSMVALVWILAIAAGCHGGGKATGACVGAGNPEALCACIAKTAPADDVVTAAFNGDFGAMQKIAPEIGQCSSSTGALGAALAKTCEQVGWDKTTCDCMRDKVSAIDKDELVKRAADRNVTSLLQVAQALSAEFPGQCAITGGTLAYDISTSCGDDAPLCACTKAALDPKKLAPPASLDALMQVVVATRDVCIVQAPDVREGVIKSCVADGGKKPACECAATAFLTTMKPSDVAELKRTGWTTDALQTLRAARSHCR